MRKHKYLRRAKERLAVRIDGYNQSITNGHDGTKSDRHKHHKPGSLKTRK